MKRVILFFVALTLATAQAQTLTTTVESVGCHINSNVCFAYVSSSLENNGECAKSTSIRWDGENSPNADKVYSLLLTAAVAGSSVVISVSDENSACVAGYPGLNWARIEGQ